MDLKEYHHMVDDVIDSLTMRTYAAAERNMYKDQRDYGNWVRGWEGFDLRAKLKEEVDELLLNPCSHEIGDVAWVLAMMQDQINFKTQFLQEDTKPASVSKQNMDKETKQ